MGTEGISRASALALITVQGAARLERMQANAVMVIDLEEHERRRALGLGAITQLYLLDSLMTLPLGCAVPAKYLHLRDRDRLLGEAAALVDATADGLVRHTRPAVEVVTVQVDTGRWTKRLQKAGTFAKFVPAEIVLHRTPSPEEMLQADYLGVGVVGAGALAGRQFVRPSIPTPTFKPVDWLFRERAYEVWLTARGDR